MGSGTLSWRSSRFPDSSRNDKSTRSAARPASASRAHRVSVKRRSRNSRGSSVSTGSSKSQDSVQTSGGRTVFRGRVFRVEAAAKSPRASSPRRSVNALGSRASSWPTVCRPQPVRIRAVSLDGSSAASGRDAMKPAASVTMRTASPDWAPCRAMFGVVAMPMWAWSPWVMRLDRSSWAQVCSASVWGGCSRLNPRRSKVHRPGAVDSRCGENP